jgi:leucyl aminopeptidase
MSMITVKSSSKSSSDILIVGLANRDGGLVVESGSSDLNKSLNAKATLESLEDLGATGAREEIIKFTPKSGYRLIIFTGLGAAQSEYPHEVLRRAAGSAVRALAGKKHADIALPHKKSEGLAAIAEGAGLGSYSFVEHRGSSKAAQKSPLASITIISSIADSAEGKVILKRAAVLTKYIHIVRDLVNTPANHLSPVSFVAKMKALCAPLGVKVEILDEKALKTKGYGGIYSVGQGSANPPRLFHISYAPTASKTAAKKKVKQIAFVGKGITFDTGGYALKPAAGMDAMKTDMAGAASVIAAALAIAELKIPVSINAYAALAENMISDNATRPGDVITTLSGKTVEVLNPDAEGRLVMADGITRAIGDAKKAGGLDVLVDVATLTGAQIIALGTRTAGVMGNNDHLIQEFLTAADAAGESFWAMPLPEELRATLETPVADIANVGDKSGGMLVAGVFLKEFVSDETPWIHLDIAGPSYVEKGPYGYNAIGATGVSVRSLVALAESAARS